MKTRTYNSEFRHAEAKERRARILACAKTLFQKEGYDFVTIEKLAQISEVSEATIYSLFQSKRGLLRAIMDESFPVEQFEALVNESKQEKSPKVRLMISAKIARQIYDAEREQMDVFQSASVLAPEFKELEREREQRRYKRQKITINAMIKEKSLSKKLKSTKARDILWAFTGRDMYRMFVIERGWSSDEYEKWLGNILISALL